MDSIFTVFSVYIDLVPISHCSCRDVQILHLFFHKTHSKRQHGQNKPRHMLQYALFVSRMTFSMCYVGVSVCILSFPSKFVEQIFKRENIKIVDAKQMCDSPGKLLSVFSTAIYFACGRYIPFTFRVCVRAFSVSSNSTLF